MEKFNFEKFMENLEKELIEAVDYTKEYEEIYDSIEQEIDYTIERKCIWYDWCWEIVKSLTDDLKYIFDEFGTLTNIAQIASGALRIEIEEQLDIDEFIAEAKAIKGVA